MCICGGGLRAFRARVRQSGKNQHSFERFYHLCYKHHLRVIMDPEPTKQIVNLSDCANQNECGTGKCTAKLDCTRTWYVILIRIYYNPTDILNSPETLRPDSEEHSELLNLSSRLSENVGQEDEGYTQQLARKPYMKYSSIAEWFGDESPQHAESVALIPFPIEVPPFAETLLDEASCGDETMQPSEQLTLSKTQIDQLEPIQNSRPLQPEKPVTSCQPGECLACALKPLFFSDVNTPKRQPAESVALIPFPIELPLLQKLF